MLEDRTVLSPLEMAGYRWGLVVLVLNRRRGCIHGMSCSCCVGEWNRMRRGSNGAVIRSCYMMLFLGAWFSIRAYIRSTEVRWAITGRQLRDVAIGIRV